VDTIGKAQDYWYDLADERVGGDLGELWQRRVDKQPRVGQE
jgi:hypothetical protein